MATTQLLIPVEEYLHSVYRPDCDYIDGEVLERNVGEKPHSRLQKFLLRFLEQFEETLQVETFPKKRLQISSTRYRIPDVMGRTRIRPRRPHRPHPTAPLHRKPL